MIMLLLPSAASRFLMLRGTAGGKCCASLPSADLAEQGTHALTSALPSGSGTAAQNLARQLEEREC